MSKTADIVFCVVNGSLLCGMGWLVVTVSQIPTPKPSEFATVAQARPVKTVIYYPSISDNVDKMAICGGGDEDYKPLGRTMLAGEPAHRC